MRLNYEKARIKIYNLVKANNFVISRKQIMNKLNLNYGSWKDDKRFLSFLSHTRKHADNLYYRLKNEEKELINVYKIITLKMLENKGSIEEFLKMCHHYQIPYLYYVDSIKHYIFPIKENLEEFYWKRMIIAFKGMMKNLKHIEYWNHWKTKEDFIEYFRKLGRDTQKELEAYAYLVFDYGDYKCGETYEEMITRLKYEEIKDKANKKIEESLKLYNIEWL